MMTDNTKEVPKLKLKQGTFQALFTQSGLESLDSAFIAYLSRYNPLLVEHLQAYRQHGSPLTFDESEFLISIAPYLEHFIAELFDIQSEVSELYQSVHDLAPLFEFKKYYVQTHAKRLHRQPPEPDQFDVLTHWLLEQLALKSIKQLIESELLVAKYATSLLESAPDHQAKIDKLVAWCYLVQSQKEHAYIIDRWVSFKLPQKRNYENLVAVEPIKNDPYQRLEGPKALMRKRDGFQLTDERMDAPEVLSEIHYCVYCHKNEGDFCSKGFPVKKNKPELGLKINPANEVLTGCPLEEKISEMHVLKKSGYAIGALATIMIDNPMCAATGHRICNDCMKACIYQKQDPVNIPQVETRVLTEVLSLPWGVEIYDLFMRWNPLRRTQYLPKPYNNKKVLVMGMGPAGFTLAHHLLMEGCAVVGADGLKIEPLPNSLLEEPIRDFSSICEPLDNRLMAGFGGVAEYGITVRWDKNFLKLIYISLARRKYFQVVGNVRFGGAITVDKAWELGFDHLSIAVGAGLPRELVIPNSLAPGMRQANDFLMALQLTGAVKKSSLANLQVRLPAIVIGGGLTGIDTATEVQAYYVTQVEKTHQRYHILKEKLGESKLRSQFDNHSLMIIDEFLLHAEAIIKERASAQRVGRTPDFTPLLRSWGGVSVVYRKSMQESPAYKRNHEEIIKALEEGIYYAQGLEPKEVIVDEFGFACALTCRSRIQDESGDWIFSDENQTLPAKSIFVATGAKPNVAYAFEHKETFDRAGMNYKRFKDDQSQLTPVTTGEHIKEDTLGVFTSYAKGDHRVSFLGDTHPIFHGSVVKAIASAKFSYPKIMQVLERHNHSTNNKQGNYDAFRRHIEDVFQARVVSNVRMTPQVVEITVHAPLSARQFQPGQFYRLQNFEAFSPSISNTVLQAEGVSALGVKNLSPDELTFYIHESGVSTRLLAMLKPGDPIALMGPTGAKTPIPLSAEVMLVVGDSLAIPYLLSVGPALKANNVSIHAIIATTQPYAIKKLQGFTDYITFVNDLSNVVEEATSDKNLVLDQYQQVHVIGSSDLLRTVSRARSNAWQTQLNPGTKFTAAVYGPMQCMLKGVCAQCLQWQKDPKTGQRTKAVYACSWQHQPMDIVDIGNIDERLAQNKAQETLSSLWLDYLFDSDSKNANTLGA